MRRPLLRRAPEYARGEAARDKNLDVGVPGEIEPGADLTDEVGRDAAALPRRVQPDGREIRPQGFGDAEGLDRLVGEGGDEHQTGDAGGRPRLLPERGARPWRDGGG